MKWLPVMKLANSCKSDSHIYLMAASAQIQPVLYLGFKVALAGLNISLLEVCQLLEMNHLNCQAVIGFP